MAKRPKQPKQHKRPKQQPGPKPDTLTVEGDWEIAVRKALEKKRPKRGWPKPPKRTGSRK